MKIAADGRDCMNDELGNRVKDVKLKSGLLGKKPTGITVYENGVEIQFKSESKKYRFEQIPAIQSTDYFAPNAIEYHFDIFHKTDGKIASLSIPYANREDGTALLEAHKKAWLGIDFPQKLPDATYMLDDHLTWEKGKLVYNGRKEREEYPARQIAAFVIKNGSHFFTVKDSKETLMVDLAYSPNCLMAAEICKAIADLE